MAASVDRDADRNAQRTQLMRICAQATDHELSAAIQLLDPASIWRAEIVELRPPEIGLTMLRGRIGGDGQAFNLGEATVTRAAVRLGTGETGMSYLLGRRPEAAKAAATIDALGQIEVNRDAIERALIEPVAHRVARERALARAAVASTRVDFFTLVRGEDQP